MPFSADHLLANILRHAPDAAGYCVAYSGGLDSHVLLHALAALRDQLPAPLVALHVNHNLQSASPVWDAHCRAVCLDLGVDYRSLSVDARPGKGESPEAAARAARYRAFAELLSAGQVLLTAHHQEDQAETLLLQLLRGAGPKGLAAMPARSGLGQGHLVRPLLDVGRIELHGYAQQRSLQWIDDPSNAQLDYDRNYLRHRILPLLRERWPATPAVLTRSAAHQAEAAQLLDDLAEIDLGADPVNPHALSISTLLGLSTARRANLLRHWLHLCGAPVPSTAVLAHIDHDVLQAAMDAVPQVAWAGVSVRRYRDTLYLETQPDLEGAVAPLNWTADEPLVLPGGVLTPVNAVGEGVAARLLAGKRLRVDFRRGGERLQPAGRREHHTLKHLFQDRGVPPWERERVPLLYFDDRLIAVAGYWVCEGFQASEQESGVRFEWRRAIVPDGSIW